MFILILQLPFFLHILFSRSNLQFPLQPWLSAVLLNFGQQLQSGNSLSPPQDTDTVNRNIVYIVSNLYRQKNNIILFQSIIHCQHLCCIDLQPQWHFHYGKDLYNIHLIYRNPIVQTCCPPCKKYHSSLAFHCEFHNNNLAQIKKIDTNET